MGENKTCVRPLRQCSMSKKLGKQKTNLETHSLINTRRPMGDLPLVARSIWAPSKEARGFNTQVPYYLG